MTETEQTSPPIEALSRQELEQQLESALQTIDRLQQIRESMHNFLRILLGYEVGVPLTSIVGYSDILLAEKEKVNLTEEEQKKFVTIIRKNAQAILRSRMLALQLINLDILVFRLRDKLLAESVDLKSVINNVAGFFENMDLAVHLPAELPNVQISERVLWYVVSRTLTTLSQEGKPNRITIDVSSAGEWVIMKIANADLNSFGHTLSPEFDPDEPILSLFSLGHLECGCYLLNLYGGQMRLEGQEGESGVMATLNLPISKDSPTE